MSRFASAPVSFVETLENRTLLSVDLTAYAAALASVSSETATVVSLDARTTRVATNPFNIPGAGTKLKFKKTTSNPGNGIQGNVSELGTFTDDKGHNGTYSLALPPPSVGNNPAQILGINFKSSSAFAGGERPYTLTFTPFSKRLAKGLNGKTVTFSTKSTGAEAKATPTVGKAIYLNY